MKKKRSEKYTDVLFSYDKENGNYSVRQQQLQFFLDVIKKNPELLRFLKAPHIMLKEKEAVLKNSFNDQFDPFFYYFLLYLTKKDRLDLLPSIEKKYRFLIQMEEGVWDADVVTAVPLDSEIEEQLTSKINRHFNKKFILHNHINKKMIGGAKLIIGNRLLDGSVRGRLRSIKTKLLEKD